ncbi:hypothetical protein AAVH_31062, partial [Aphelenchoides avenae]
VIILAMLIAVAVAGSNGIDVAACVRIVRGICNGGVWDTVNCIVECGGIPHVGVCLKIPPLDLGAE